MTFFLNRDFFLRIGRIGEEEEEETVSSFFLSFIFVCVVNNAMR